MNTLSLFTGAGGLDLGLEAAGFRIVGCVEKNSDARKTLETNRRDWRLLDAPASDPGDILGLEPDEILTYFDIAPEELTLISGGPPCQPFSKSGLWLTGSTPGMADPRAKTLRAFLRLVDVARPEFMLLENVHGIAASANGKPRSAALAVLKRELAAINRRHGTSYKTCVLDVDAADFGVPQHRRRLFIFAARNGSTLAELDVRHGAPGSGLRPYRTAWDGIGDLDETSIARELRLKGRWAELLPSIPEGQNYQWHTPRGGGEPLFGWRRRYWSFLLKLAKDRPSWTLQAEPGPATGPFHWRDRLLSIEEMARLQTFPEGYKIEGSYGSARRQLGNAVPAAVGELLGLEIRRQIHGVRVRKRLRLIPDARDDCPGPYATEPVPDRYLHLRDDHPAHPGVGLGPDAVNRQAA